MPLSICPSRSEVDVAAPAFAASELPVVRFSVWALLPHRLPHRLPYRLPYRLPHRFASLRSYALPCAAERDTRVEMGGRAPDTIVLWPGYEMDCRWPTMAMRRTSAQA